MLTRVTGNTEVCYVEELFGLAWILNITPVEVDVTGNEPREFGQPQDSHAGLLRPRLRLLTEQHCPLRKKKYVSQVWVGTMYEMS